MMSEGTLCEPVDPDYQSPTVRYTYEVEYKDSTTEGAGWTKYEFVDGRPGTDDLTLARRIKAEFEEVAYRCRIIRVETIRSQVSD